MKILKMTSTKIFFYYFFIKYIYTIKMCCGKSKIENILFINKTFNKKDSILNSSYVNEMILNLKLTDYENMVNYKGEWESLLNQNEDEINKNLDQKSCPELDFIILRLFCHIKNQCRVLKNLIDNQKDIENDQYLLTDLLRLNIFLYKFKYVKIYDECQLNSFKEMCEIKKLILELCDKVICLF